MGDTVLYGVVVLLPFLWAGCLIALARSRLRRVNTWNRTSLIVGNALVFLLLCSILFGALETYYRFWYDTTDSLAETLVSRRWFERHYHRTSAGFRDNVNYRFARTPGKRRVSFVGDSFTAGHGIANVEDRFPNRVRAMKKDQWEVHVLADVGYDTRTELTRMRDLIGDHYQPDVVVLVYCLNDICETIRAHASNSLVSSSAVSPGFLLEHSYLINTYYYRIKARWDPNLANYYGSVRGAYEGPIWEEQREVLRSFRDVCQGAGGRLLAVTFPFLHALGSEYEHRSAHEKLAQLWQDLDVPYLDLLAMFEAHRAEQLTVNRYDAHPNERAHALAADSIAQFLDREN